MSAAPLAALSAALSLLATVMARYVHQQMAAVLLLIAAIALALAATVSAIANWKRRYEPG